MGNLDLWKFVAGLGLFLFGMYRLEEATKQVEGRAFKLFLKNNTNNKMRALFSGTLVTAVLQSSSLVNLILLSFVGAEMITMPNALGVVLGSSIGGTANSWLLYVLGFGANISRVTMPVIGLAGIGLIVFRNHDKPFRFFSFCMAYGLLFLGLEFMKESMDFLVENFDFAKHLAHSNLVFMLLGILITVIIQSSAATVVIVLTALHSNILDLEPAVAIVMGAELGTTFKVLLGSVGGSAAKKRVAVFNSGFNLATSILGLVTIPYIILFIEKVLHFNNPLLVLVSFQTILNICGVLLFFNFLKPIAGFLEKIFKNGDAETATLYLTTATPEMPGASLQILEKETGAFIGRVIQLNLESFLVDNEDPVRKTFKELFPGRFSYVQKYNLLKSAEGEILLFFSRLGYQKLEKTEMVHLNNLMSSVRNAMYSAKCMKDILHNRKELSNSANDLEYEQFILFQRELFQFYKKINEIIDIADKKKYNEALNKFLATARVEYENKVLELYTHTGKQGFTSTMLSALFNINREIYSAEKALITALIHLRDGTVEE